MARLGWGWHTPVPSILGTLALLGCCPHVLRAPVWELPDLPRALAQASPAGCSVCWPWSIQCPLGLQASEHPSGTRRGPLEAQGSQPHLVVQGVEGRSGHGGAVWALQPLLEGAWLYPYVFSDQVQMGLEGFVRHQAEFPNLFTPLLTRQLKN